MLPYIFLKLCITKAHAIFRWRNLINIQFPTECGAALTKIDFNKLQCCSMHVVFCVSKYTYLHTHPHCSNLSLTYNDSKLNFAAVNSQWRQPNKWNKLTIIQSWFAYCITSDYRKRSFFIAKLSYPFTYLSKYFIHRKFISTYNYQRTYLYMCSLAPFVVNALEKSMKYFQCM